MAAAFEAALTPAWQAAHPEAGPVRAVEAVGTPEEVTARCLRVLAAAVPSLADADAPDGRTVVAVGDRVHG